MQSLHKLTVFERKKTLRAAILRRFQSISSDQLNYLCDTLNTKHPYYIKHASDKQKFLNLATRELIISDGVRSITEVMPLYGDFESPFFERIGPNRHFSEGRINESMQAAAVKIRVANENKRCSATHTLILFG